MAVSPASPERLLLQFVRAPEPGAVKTRMMPELSAGEACRLHTALFAHTARRLAAVGDCQREIWVDGDVADPLFRDRGAGLRSQCGADLGERMHRAFTDALARAGVAVLVGSDCPAIDAAYIEAAFDALVGAELVLGPALDGGYVLIGLRRSVGALFDGVPWGTERVLDATLDRAAALGWRTSLLQPLQDIDRPSDLPAWRSQCAAVSAG
jgi:rSAM/selenodomain-associated transferase 1